MAQYSSSSSSSSKIVLKSSDEKSFEVDEKMARQSLTLKHNLEGVDDSSATTNAIEIPLPNVTGDILGKVVEYCKMHVDDDDHPKSQDFSTANQDLKNWDREFLRNFDYDTLFRLTLAANYMEIPNLLDICCQSIADSIKDKSVEEVRKIFNIENDFTPEEEAALRKENEWAFE